MARSNRRATVYANRKSKRHKVSKVSTAQVRRLARKSQLKIGLKTIQMKKVVSQRGRTSVMEAPLPGMPQTPQTLLMASTAIRKFKYDFKSRNLRIWFVNPGNHPYYDYHDVPESVVLELGRAQSKGHYFYYNIRTSFSFTPG